MSYERFLITDIKTERIYFFGQVRETGFFEEKTF